jgi:hypothetical protein
MSSGTNAHPARAGFNQSGGAYFMVLRELDPIVAVGAAPTAAASSHVQALVNPGSNSGGAWLPPTLSTVTYAGFLGVPYGAAGVATAQTVGVTGYVSTGKLLKDMGRTVVSAGRTFRKFAPVVAGLGVSSFGVGGSLPSGANSGYGSFYLEVGREGLTGTPAGLGPAPIARYF